MELDKLGGKNIAVAEGAAGLPVLGWIEGHTVRQGEINIEEFDQMAREIGIPISQYPNENRIKDRFKIAVRELEYHTFEDHHKYGKCRIEYTVDKLTPDEYVMTRKVFPHDDESNKHMLEHEKLMRLKLILDENEKNKGTVVVAKYDEASSITTADMEATASNVNARLVELMNVYDSDQLRSTLRAAIKSCNAIPYTMAESIYFVPKEYEHILKAWKSFLELFDAKYSLSHGAYHTQMRILPCIDCDEQRQYLKSDVEAELNKQLQALVDDIVIRIQKGDVANLDAVMAAREQIKKNIGTMKDKYSGLLGKPIEVTFTAQQKDTILFAAQNRFDSVIGELDKDIDLNKTKCAILDVLGFTDIERKELSRFDFLEIPK